MSGYLSRDDDIIPFSGDAPPSAAQQARLRSLSNDRALNNELARYRTADQNRRFSETQSAAGGFRSKANMSPSPSRALRLAADDRYRDLEADRYGSRKPAPGQKGVRFLEPSFPKEDYGGDPRHSLQELSLSDRRRRRNRYYESSNEDDDSDDYNDAGRYSDEDYYGRPGTGGSGAIRSGGRRQSMSNAVVRRGHSRNRGSEDLTVNRGKREITYEEELIPAALPVDDLGGGSEHTTADFRSRIGEIEDVDVGYGRGGTGRDDEYIPTAAYRANESAAADNYRSHEPAVVGLPRPKRIVICCDGTWLDADNGLRNRQIFTPSNVTRLGRAIKAIAADGTPQVVFYQEGVGSDGGQINRAFEGVTGSGITAHIREAYSFLCNNFVDGDEIFFVGFSRGAFTARSIAALVADLGVMTKAGLHYFPIIFEDWQHRHEPGYRSRERDLPFARKPCALDPEYLRELARRGYTTPNVPIKALAVWETVGSLGIPRINWLERVGLQNMGMKKYNFWDTSIHPLIEHAFQALALDEQRGAFQPAVWELRHDNDMTDLVQVWFPGVHSNVGGGYRDQEIANITLAWMMNMLSPLLDFDDSAILRLDDANKRHQRRIRPWSFGKIYNSMNGVYAVGGTQERTPGEYCRVDPDTGKPTRHLLKNTNEFIHPCVRTRTLLDGPGVEDRGDYRPKALKRWRLVEDQAGRKFWRKKGQNDLLIPECSMGEIEMLLLERSSKMYDYLTDPRN